MKDTGFYFDVFVFSEKVQILSLCIFDILAIFKNGSLFESKAAPKFLFTCLYPLHSDHTKEYFIL